MLSKEVLSLLNRDPIKNSNILGFAAYNTVTDVHVFGDSVLLRGQSDRAWVYISSDSMEELRALLPLLTEEDTCFAVIEDWMMPEIVGETPLKWCLSSLKLVLPNDQQLACVASSVEALDPSVAEYIYKNYDYQEFTSVAYIEERLKKGPSAGVCHDDKPIAWALTHDDGAIGLLKVLDDYRGRGHALAVTSYLAEQIRQQGGVPFVHIEEDNAQSLGLTQKMGFVKQGITHWFELDK